MKVSDLKNNLSRIAPWNWFKREQETQQASGAMQVHKPGLPTRTDHAISPFLQLHREIDRVFDEAFRGLGWPMSSLPAQTEWEGMLRPVLDIEEGADVYKVSIEVPGVDEKDIQLSLDDDVLIVRGEKRQESEHRDENGGFHRIERSYGSFQRMLNLPANADTNDISARFRNGVLTVTIGKRQTSAERTGRRIPIES